MKNARRRVTSLIAIVTLATTANGQLEVIADGASSFLDGAQETAEALAEAAGGFVGAVSGALDLSRGLDPVTFGLLEMQLEALESLHPGRFDDILLDTARVANRDGSRGEIQGNLSSVRTSMPQALVPLSQHWQSKRGDHFLATPSGALGAGRARYVGLGHRGLIFRDTRPGTRALKLFYHKGRGDNFSTATSQGERDARKAGYRFVRTQGFVLSDQAPGTAALKLFWHAKRGDNLSVCTPEMEKKARAAGYRFVRTQGYVLSVSGAASTEKLVARSPMEESLLEPIRLYWGKARGDHLSVTSAGLGDARRARYVDLGSQGALLRQGRPGAVPLKLFYHPGRGDNFSSSTARGEQDARNAGYRYVRTQGFVLSDQAPGTVPLKLFWHSGRSDNFSASTEAQAKAALRAGYRFVRVQGYVYPTEDCRDVAQSGQEWSDCGR